jgi:hypothetical protein
MSTSFRSSYEVIQRNIGTIVNGKYMLAEDSGVKTTIQATIQQPSVGDHAIIQATPYGRRAARFIKVFTDTRLHCANQEIAPGRERYPGDIILFDGSEYLLFGESNFNELKKTRANNVSHWRYYACETIEDAFMDEAP